MKNYAILDVTSCGCCKSRRFGGTYRLNHQGDKNQLARNVSVLQLLVTANVVHSSSILVALMMGTLSPSETSIPTRATRRHIPEDGILHSHRRENLKSYREQYLPLAGDHIHPTRV
jgi:hypothetical protein